MYGFGMLPDSQNPNASPGELHPIALNQLVVYQVAATDWPRYPDGRCVRCGKCDQSIYMRWDKNHVRYQYTKDEILGLVVAHIRQNHEEAFIDHGA
jgi:hypothetical protein